MFWPETVALTRDRGATWTPLPTADVRVTTLVAHDGAVVLLPGGVRDHFARTVDLENGQLSRVITPAEVRAKLKLEKRAPVAK